MTDFLFVEKECVHCTVGTESLNMNDIKLSLQRVKLPFVTAGSTSSQTHIFCLMRLRIYKFHSNRIYTHATVLN